MEVAAQPKAGPKKIVLGLGLIAAFATLIFVVPSATGHDMNPIILVSAFILVSVYIVLSFEFLHRTSVALIGAVAIIIAALVLGSIRAEESFEFIVSVIDYNTIGLLLGMMIIVAILAESGVFSGSVSKRARPVRVICGSCCFYYAHLLLLRRCS